MSTSDDSLLKLQFRDIQQNYNTNCKCKMSDLKILIAPFQIRINVINFDTFIRINMSKITFQHVINMKLLVRYFKLLIGTQFSKVLYILYLEQISIHITHTSKCSIDICRQWLPFQTVCIQSLQLYVKILFFILSNNKGIIIITQVLWRVVFSISQVSEVTFSFLL